MRHFCYVYTRQANYESAHEWALQTHVNRENARTTLDPATFVQGRFQQKYLLSVTNFSSITIH